MPEIVHRSIWRTIALRHFACRQFTSSCLLFSFAIRLALEYSMQIDNKSHFCGTIHVVSMLMNFPCRLTEECQK